MTEYSILTGNGTRSDANRFHVRNMVRVLHHISSIRTPVPPEAADAEDLSFAPATATKPFLKALAISAGVKKARGGMEGVELRD